MEFNIEKCPIRAEVKQGKDIFRLIEWNGWPCEIINQFLLDWYNKEHGHMIIGHTAVVPIEKYIFSTEEGHEDEIAEVIIDHFQTDTEFFFNIDENPLSNEQFTLCKQLLKQGRDYLMKIFEIVEE